MKYLNEKVWVAVDCLVFGYELSSQSIHVLTFKRQVAPYEGQWSLIGGIVDPEEDLDTAALNVLKRFTGLDDVYMDQLTTYGKVSRDPVGRVISVLYWSFIQLDDYHREKVAELGAEWYPVNELPRLVLDHEQMVASGRAKLLEQAKHSPIGFELLPDKFTLPQLLKLYEAIYDSQLDDRNFRKKILSTGVLRKLDEKDKSGSRRGAFYYEYDKEKYEAIKEQGYLLTLF